MDFFLAVVAGFAVGCIHAFDVDHVTAVTVFVSRNPEPRRAARLGFRWGLGHAMTVLVLGSLFIALKYVIPPLVQSVAEVVVGVLLVVLGGWALREVFRSHRIHLHRHKHDGAEHTHFHSHSHRRDHQHKHSMFLIGATHGFAGTASVMVMIPVVIASSFYAAVLYLVVFGVGTILSMSLLARFAARLATSLPVKNAVTWFQGVAGAVTVCVGCFWIVRILW